MFKYNYKLARPDSKSETAIYLLINKYGLKFPLGISILPNEWDNKKKISKADPAINKKLIELDEHLRDIYNQCLTDNIIPDAAYLRSELEIKLKRKKIEGTSFYIAFEDFKKRPVKSNTIRKYNTISNHLKKYKPNITFSEINLTFLDDFTAYLIKQGNHNNSIAKAISVIKAFMKWTQDRGYHSNEIYKKFSPDEWEEKTDIIYLTEQELRTASSKKLSKPHYEEIRDYFILSCLTGLRFSDIKDLKRENIDCVKNVIIKDTIKTGERVLIPLLPTAKEIILKYWDREGFIPVRTNQKSNEHLKEIFKEIELKSKIVQVRHKGSERKSTVSEKWQRITTHVARRTFCSLSRKMGLSDDVIMKITGITDPATLKKYKHLDQQTAADEMMDKWGKLGL